MQLRGKKFGEEVETGVNAKNSNPPSFFSMPSAEGAVVGRISVFLLLGRHHQSFSFLCNTKIIISNPKPELIKVELGALTLVYC